MYMDEVVLQSQSGSGFCTRAVGTKSRRWSPTAQQVKVLTDLFASGLRTPTTEQIQMISSHLGSFGKVESKNVFYWFQNHKARDRHHRKRRRGSSGGGGDICVIGLDNKKEARCSQDIRREWEQEVQVWEQREREIATLELFPLSSYGSERVKAERKEWREVSFSDIAGRDPVPLALRLSFSCK